MGPLICFLVLACSIGCICNGSMIFRRPEVWEEFYGASDEVRYLSPPKYYSPVSKPLQFLRSDGVQPLPPPVEIQKK